jgi:glycosyltransferase involved in cell wall biosynthesis
METDNFSFVHNNLYVEQPVLVSVVVTCFNYENFITQTLDSILMQHANFKVEILINDDASADKSALILQEYERNYPNLFKIIYQKENQYSKGIKPWFDILFPQAKGKYIALCEGDDYWTDPFKLQKQVDFLENNTDVNICFHRASLLKNGIYSLHEIPDNIENETFSFIELLRHYNFITTASVLFRKPENFIIPSRFSNIPFGDLGLYQLITMDNKKIYCLNEVMSVYRIHDKGVWSGLSQLDAHTKYLAFYNNIYEGLNTAEKKVVLQKIKNISVKISKLRFPKNRFFQKIYSGKLLLKNLLK